MNKSVLYKLVNPDGVIVDAGSRKAMKRLCKGKGAGWFVGLGSPITADIGKRWN